MLHSCNYNHTGYGCVHILMRCKLQVYTHKHEVVQCHVLNTSLQAQSSLLEAWLELMCLQT